MAYKRITSKKTPTGYSVTVFVKDGTIVKPLVAGISKFFDHIDNYDNGQVTLTPKSQFDSELERMRGAKIIKYTGRDK